MYIIADSGSTKTEWCIVNREGGRTIFRTSGINPVHLSQQEISEVLNREMCCERKGIRKIFFYGAGCAFPEKNVFIKNALTDFFQVEEVEVASDLLAAARALCKNSPGITCILGTGSNSCYYDGKEIIHNVPPLGFILGDEGSGAVLGKRLLGNVLKGICSAEISELFDKEYGYTYGELIDKVYRQPLPNRFLAGLTEFVYKYIAHPEMESLVSTSLDEFIERNVLQYQEAKMYPVSFTGSTAFYFKEILKTRLDKYGLKIGQVSKAPMEDLIEFHERSL
ncbi:ATPase [Porphyromonadaceae bacterium OttesenSCG-928-L07]|nr:ATPase [Porphyromonadaceae bacterium OttesenSCG-928-L07]MDL2251790.1 ATPase [Odoribacter sp. OttesenSCG-928-J03]MDL2330865.1 ATPase [Odoribacter sp. OttesenSCG-928-A06]